jgi:biotin synthase
VYITENIDIEVCGSLGALDFSQLKQLKQAGLSRFHHNIETSQNFYPKIVSTHNFSQRIKTIKSAKQAGLKVCSGGILGMGESPRDRLDMAITLKELCVDSVPLNILVPIKGTGLEGIKPLRCEQAVRTIAIFRIVLEDVPIKIAAGREQTFSDCPVKPFRAGANGMMIGGYLTVKGAKLQSDYQLIKQIQALWNE